jgi:hypothetical protein
VDPRQTLTLFDAYLADRRLRLEAVVIGGAALNLLGVVSRPTQDCDILHPLLPPSIAGAARSFAVELRATGELLQDDWLNNGPMSLAGQLPGGWQDRTQPVFRGMAIELSCLGRIDLLRSKLFALCDRGLDLGDCIALAPSAGELREVLPWLEAQDAHPDWPTHVRATASDLSKRLAHGV